MADWADKAARSVIKDAMNPDSITAVNNIPRLAARVREAEAEVERLKGEVNKCDQF